MGDTEAYPTLPLPDDIGQMAQQPAPRRRRRRWPWVVLGAVLLLALLVVVAELVARAVVPGIVRDVVIENMDLPADQQLDVDVSGILLPQLVRGRLDQVHLASDSVELGGITGAVEVSATDVVFGTGAIGAASGSVTIDEAQFATLVEKADLPIEEVTLDSPDVTVGGSIDIFTMSVPLSVTVEPGAEEGELLLTPVSVSIAGMDVDLSDVADRLGGIGDGLTQPHRVCIADRLPAGLTLTGFEISGDLAVAEFDVNGRIGVDPTLQEPGSC